jgi:cation diffusion facilitator CzcD-associated flavoprotein CzcO
LFVDEVMTGSSPGVTEAAGGRGTRTVGMPDVEAAVIGAGPHGLSAAIHLRRAGVAAQAFGRPMSFWRGMPKGMRLRSNMSATSMVEPVGPFSLASYMDEIGEEFGHPVSLRRFIDYGTWVQRSGVPDVDTRTVARLSRQNGGFALEFEDGERVTSRRVVVACGIADFENMPSGFSHLPAGLVSHT